MTVKEKNFLLALAEYRDLFKVLAILFMIGFLIALIYSVWKYVQATHKKKTTAVASKAELKNLDYNKVKKNRKVEIIKEFVSPDGVDCGTNSYLIINDAGKDVYIRTFTISQMPKKTSFANTFASLLDFPGCTSSIFVNPISEVEASRKMDKQITILGAEFSAANGDPNRERKVRAQFAEVNGWAEEVESGENKFYSVGFVFSLMADSIIELNKLSDAFHSAALARSITITNCYAVQAEAYSKNSPFGVVIQTGKKSFISVDAVKYWNMDKYSLSTIFNYTQVSFSHKDGIPLGRDMSTGDPVLYDLFDPSHDGFTLVIAGKTGSGKSATIKMYVSRSIIYGYKYVCIDSQTVSGTNEGEFSGIAKLSGGRCFKISNQSDSVLNPFEIAETTKTVKDSHTSVREIRTLELKEKIGMVVNTLLTMIQGSKSFKDLESMIPINRILTDVCTTLYNDFGIFDGQPDSLYESGVELVNGQLFSGKKKKQLPTLTDYYKRILLAEKSNTDSTLTDYYNLIKMALRDFVKELYYSKDSITFFTAEEFLNQPLKDAQGVARYYSNPVTGKNEDIIQIHGIRAYYDGQSNVYVDEDCPFTNIDISQLSESEKVLARQIGIDFLNESFIKKNSESIKTASKLVAIFDECHENFGFEYARKTLDNVVRTARKRHCGIILSSQTLKEYDNFTETQAILKQATTKFVFKQDTQDKNYLLNTIGFTESQVEYITETLGGGKFVDETSKNKHRGEVCILDNKKVAFCKVDYLRETEALPVETDAREIEKLLQVVS